MNRKTKKRLNVLGPKLQTLRQQLRGARRQTDEPDEVKRLSEEIATLEAEIRRLKES